MRKFLCILRIAGTDYAVLCNADNAYMAEHKFLDRGICGRYEYGCEGCTAFDLDSPETLAYVLFSAKGTISVTEAYGMIAENNDRIMRSEGR